MSKTLITEEWLAKVGERYVGKYSDICYWLCRDESGGRAFIENSTKFPSGWVLGCGIEDRCGIEYRGIEYVEDVVICLRLCGLDELADALKVKD